MKFLLTILILLSSFGCREDYLEIDPELEEVLIFYLSIAPTQGSLNQMTSIRWGDPGDGNAGSCNRFGRNYGLFSRRSKEIVIRRDDAHPCMTRRTIVHELAHCLHDFKHTDDPNDIMFGGDEVVDDLEVREEFWCKNIEEKTKGLFYR